MEKRMKILVTGAKGMVGTALCNNLKNIRDGKNRTRPNIAIDEIYEYDLDSTDEELDEYCAKADFVFNLAGVNRPENPEDFMLTPYFVVNMPPLMDVMTALLLSFTIGLGLSNIAGTTLRDSFTDFKEIIIKLIEVVIIPLLPLHIFGIFLNMTVSGQVMSIITMFLKVIIVIFALHVLLLLIQFTIAGAIAGKNPLRLLKNMLPAYATALGTQSSAATIPVTLAQAVKNGVRENIAIFTVPLCATIHLAGSTMKIVACAMAIMIMAGEPVTFSNFSGFIMMLGITMVAAPGVPGGAIMAALGILQSMLGFNETLQALMIALYIAMDSFGTACNVTGDGAIAVVVDKIAGKNTP